MGADLSKYWRCVTLTRSGERGAAGRFTLQFTVNFKDFSNFKKFTVNFKYFCRGHLLPWIRAWLTS
jgi:hypothetical protein